jgi:hypothetical protein
MDIDMLPEVRVPMAPKTKFPCTDVDDQPHVLVEQLPASQQQVPRTSTGANAAVMISDLQQPLLSPPASTEGSPERAHSLSHDEMSMREMATIAEAQLETRMEEELFVGIARGSSGSSGKRMRSTSVSAASTPNKEGHMMSRMFPRMGDMSQAVSQAVNQKANRADLFANHGIWQRIARHPVFEAGTLAVIVMNTIWIAIDTDYNHADVLCKAPLIFQIADNLFCSFFTFELTFRFMALKDKKLAYHDGWFVFDAALVVLMIWETWGQVWLYISLGVNWGGNARSSTIFRIFRIFRITRVARTAKLLHRVPELMILVKGMTIAMRSVFAILCLLSLTIYIFAIIFAQLLAGTAVG